MVIHFPKSDQKWNYILDSSDEVRKILLSNNSLLDLKIMSSTVRKEISELLITFKEELETKRRLDKKFWGSSTEVFTSAYLNELKEKSLIGLNNFNEIKLLRFELENLLNIELPPYYKFLDQSDKDKFELEKQEKIAFLRKRAFLTGKKLKIINNTDFLFETIAKLD